MKWPECPVGREDCRLSESREFSTCVGWTPEYDRTGRLVNQDPNTYSSQINCSVCKRSWSRVQHRGTVTIEELS